MNFFLGMAISVLLSTLKEIVKNKEKKAEMKKAMLKVSRAINTVYGDDPDFA